MVGVGLGLHRWLPLATAIPVLALFGVLFIAGFAFVIGLMAAAWVNLGFVAFSEKAMTWFNLAEEPSIWIALVASMLLLALVMRSLIAPLYLIVSVVLSYFSALGLTGLVFMKAAGQPGAGEGPGVRADGPGGPCAPCRGVGERAGGPAPGSWGWGRGGRRRRRRRAAGTRCPR